MGGDGDRSVSSVEEVLPAAARRGRTDLLVTGRSAELLRGVFGALVGSDDGVVLATTRAPPSLLVTRYGFDGAGDCLAVVDCTPGGTGVDAGSDRLHWTVPSPANLQESQIAISECLEVIGQNGADRRHLVFDSLTTVLRTVDVETVLQFAHGIRLANDGRDGLGLFPVYPPSTDGSALERLKTVFDGLLEVRATSAATEVRVRGFRNTPEGWVRIDPRAAAAAGDVD